MWLNDLLSATPLARAWPTECDSPETRVDRVRLERHVALLRVACGVWQFAQLTCPHLVLLLLPPAAPGSRRRRFHGRPRGVAIWREQQQLRVRAVRVARHTVPCAHVLTRRAPRALPVPSWTPWWHACCTTCAAARARASQRR